MDAPRLSPLDHRLPGIAAEIHRVMLAGYRVEAALLGVADFVPARRAAADIASLVVHPEHFRKGLGTALRLCAGFVFRHHRRWHTGDGIPMVTLIRRSSAVAS